MKWRIEIVFVLYGGWRNAQQASSCKSLHPVFERAGPASKANCYPELHLQLLKQLSDYLKLSDSMKVRGEQLATGVYTNRKKTGTRSGKNQVRKTDKSLFWWVLYKRLWTEKNCITSSIFITIVSNKASPESFAQNMHTVSASASSK